MEQKAATLVHEHLAPILGKLGSRRKSVASTRAEAEAHTAKRQREVDELEAEMVKLREQVRAKHLTPVC